MIVLLGGGEAVCFSFQGVSQLFQVPGAAEEFIPGPFEATDNAAFRKAQELS